MRPISCMVCYLMREKQMNLVNLGGTLVILLIAVNAYPGGKNVKAA